jgi:DMSO/TMAO reductase YedYZ molybdopterin-dependent catalytic subunit
MQTHAEPAALDQAEDGVDRRLAGVAGMVAAAVALGVTELISGFRDAHQSLVVIVGNGVIDLSPSFLTRFGIDTFGTGDKPALVVGIIVISLAVGYGIGRAAVARKWIPLAVFDAFAVVGIVAALNDDLADGTVSVFAALLGAAAGVATFYALLAVLRGGVSLAPPPAPSPSLSVRIEYPTDPHATRRAFFAWSGGLTAFAVLAAAGGRTLRGRGRAEAARSEVVLRTPTIEETPGVGLESSVDDVTPLITPNDDFYRIDTALIVPQVDPADWSLSIKGMVDDPITLTFDQLLDLATVESTITMACVSNEVGGDLIGNAVWQGLPLGDLLDQAGVQEGATQIVGRSVDGFTVGFPTEVAFDGRPAMVAVGMNGEPLPVPHGFPARLVVSGLYGYISATKWLSEIELTTWDAFDGYWIPRGWSKEAPVKTQSRIDVPRNRGSIDAGPRRIAGVAWATGRGIERVEVQVDDADWIDAELGVALSNDTWRQWVVDWEAEPGSHTIRVRATDGDGETQTDKRSRPDPNGATGWHTVDVDVAG